MSPRPALITQAEMERAIRAAKKQGAAGVELRPDGTLFVRLIPLSTDQEPTLAPEKVIAL